MDGSDQEMQPYRRSDQAPDWTEQETALGAIGRRARRQIRRHFARTFVAPEALPTLSANGIPLTSLAQMDQTVTIPSNGPASDEPAWRDLGAGSLAPLPTHIYGFSVNAPRDGFDPSTGEKRCAETDDAHQHKRLRTNTPSQQPRETDNFQMECASSEETDDMVFRMQNRS